VTELSRTAQGIRASVFADLAARIEAHARGGGDLVALHIGDTNVLPPEGARFDRIEEPGELDVALYRYGALPGLERLKEVFAARLARSGIGPRDVDPSRHVLVGSGATHAIFCSLRAVLEPGDEVIVTAPYWPLSVGVVRAAGGVPVEVPLTTRLYTDPGLDPAAVLAEALTPRTKVLYLITPNNPDGYVLDDEQLRRIGALAAERGLWIVSDEVYSDYVYEGSHASIGRLDGLAQRTISAYSISKSHALAGARVGFVVAPEPVVSLARRVATHTVFNVPVASQRVALAALSTGDAWLEHSRLACRDARDATLAALAGSGVTVHVPRGGSYVFLDFSPVLRGAPLRTLLEHAIDRGVLLAPGDGCGEAFASWARLCFTAVPRERLLEGVARLRAAIHDL
jgi:aspartate/methionine/tyrosine aminotransferase